MEDEIFWPTFANHLDEIDKFYQIVCDCDNCKTSTIVQLNYRFFEHVVRYQLWIALRERRHIPNVFDEKLMSAALTLTDDEMRSLCINGIGWYTDELELMAKKFTIEEIARLGIMIKLWSNDTLSKFAEEKISAAISKLGN